MAKKSVFVGIDVSKDHLDVAVRPSSRRFTVANDEQGLAQLARRLLRSRPKLVVMEATGGFEYLAAACLAAKGIPVVVVNPRQVRDFARSTGQLAKTDRIDAEILALFAERVQPKPRPLADETQRGLDALMTRRRQLVQMITAEKNRLGFAPPGVREGIREHIEWLKRQLDNVEGDLGRMIQTSPLWRIKNELLQSAPGVGPVLSRTCIADLPELGSLNRKQIAKLVGIAPLARDSGKQRGKRMVWGGRASVRSALYMATLTATKHNPVIRSFYNRLRDAGKAPKVALTACMRKLLTILNAMVRTQTHWRVQKSENFP